MSIQVELRHVIYALSDALDLVGVDDVAHGKRVGVMAAACAEVLHLAEAERGFLFDLGLLHDIGVSSTRTHRHLVAEFDWAGSGEHAEIGYELLASFAPLAEMALPVRYHHSRWDELNSVDLDPEVARAANLIHLVDRVDALAAPYLGQNATLAHKEEVRGEIRRRAGTYFAPDLVEVFINASRSEAFWLALEPRAIQSRLLDQMARGGSYQATAAELKQLAVIFSRIVDAKSPFTAEHSLGVARVARFLAEQMGVDADNCDKLEIAGLLHDLGKLRVPDEILDKPDRLDPAERLVINAHSFETYQILRNIKGFEEIALWAAYHHEKPDGSGYPFHLTAAEMELEARILRVADIFQAVVQDRPYRDGLSADEALRFLQDLNARDEVDDDVVAVLAKDVARAIQIALPDER